MKQGKNKLEDPLLEGYFEQFQIQASSHPGGESMRALFFALDAMRNHKELRIFISEVVTNRAELNPQHFSTLFPRAIQYVLYMAHNNREYPSYTRKDWESFLLDMVKPESLHGQTIKDILTTRSTNTTIIERYLGPRLIIAGLFPKQRIFITEFGSSIGLGIRELEHGNTLLEKVEDKTPDLITKKLARIRLNIIGGIAIDREELESDIDWVAACSVYFQDIETLGKILAKYASYKKSSNIVIHQADMLDPDLVVDPTLRKSGRVSINTGSADVSIVLTCLYELSDAEIVVALDNIRRATKPNGVVIISDFFGLERPSKKSSLSTYIPLTNLGIKDKRALTHYKDFYKGDTYRSLVFMLNSKQQFKKAWEVFRWNHARCEVLYPGSDYPKFQRLIGKKSKVR